MKSKLLAAAFALALTVPAMLATTAADAASRDVQVRSATKYYSIGGSTPSQFAAQMSARGPFSGQHRKRVWATASRTMRYTLDRQRKGGTCRIARARVFMQINYTMPRLRSKVSSRNRTRWNQMYKILNSHEKVHGRYYTQLAKKTQAALRNLRPSRSCAALDRKAARIVAKLSKQNQRINDRFDRTDQRNYRRMERLYAFR